MKFQPKFIELYKIARPDCSNANLKKAWNGFKDGNFAILDDGKTILLSGKNLDGLVKKHGSTIHFWEDEAYKSEFKTADEILAERVIEAEELQAAAQQNSALPNNGSQRTKKNIIKLPFTHNKAIVSPVIDVEQAVYHFGYFKQLKAKLLDDSCIIYYGKDGRPTTKGNGTKGYITKKGWRILALVFNIDLDIIEKEKIFSTDSFGGYYIWVYRVKAAAPNGRFVIAEGACSSRHKLYAKRYKRGTNGKKIWNKDKAEYEHFFIEPDESLIIRTAQTIGYNRAISDLVGGGEMSKEEFELQEHFK